MMLTTGGQARRLRPLAFAALQQYDLEVVRLSLVTNEFNGSFRIDTRDHQKYILRVTLPQGGHDLDHIAAEMAWLEALSRETRLSVPRVVPAKDGSLVVEAAAAGVPEARLCAVFSWVPGTDLARHNIQGGTTHEGIHLGAMAGTVDILQRCYTGLEFHDDILFLNPSIPQGLPRLSMRIKYRGNWLDISATPSAMTISASQCELEATKVSFQDKVYHLNFARNCPP